MMSIEYIEELAKEAGIEAEELGKEPYEIEHEWEPEHWPPFPFPNLGSYCPEGWELVDNFRADSSGFGSPVEPALTPEQLKKRVKVGYGYAIIETGQFQVVIGEFKRKM